MGVNVDGLGWMSMDEIWWCFGDGYGGMIFVNKEGYWTIFSVKKFQKMVKVILKIVIIIKRKAVKRLPNKAMVVMTLY